jgi:hypothetical protein
MLSFVFGTFAVYKLNFISYRSYYPSNADMVL